MLLYAVTVTVSIAVTIAVTISVSSATSIAATSIAVIMCVKLCQHFGHSEHRSNYGCILICIRWMCRAQKGLVAH